MEFPSLTFLGTVRPLHFNSKLEHGLARYLHKLVTLKYLERTEWLISRLVQMLRSQQLGPCRPQELPCWQRRPEPLLAREDVIPHIRQGRRSAQRLLPLESARAELELPSRRGRMPEPPPGTNAACAPRSQEPFTDRHRRAAQRRKARTQAGPRHRALR